MTKTNADCLHFLPDRRLGSFHRLRDVHRRRPRFRVGFELSYVVFCPGTASGKPKLASWQQTVGGHAENEFGEKPLRVAHGEADFLSNPRRFNRHIPGRCLPTNFAADVPRPTSKWHLDEMAARIGGQQFSLWPAVDDEGEVLDLLVQRRRAAKAKFL
jgi:DDE domain